MFRDFDQSTIHNSSSVISSSNRKNKDHYKKNKLSGPYLEIDPITGNVLEVGEFQYGLEVGLWKVIDDDGDQQHFRYKQQRVGARCRDGSFSSATGRGACSWHGGVEEWLTQNQRYQVGGTGKYEPIEQRLQKVKLKLKDELDFNVNKQTTELLLDVAQNLLKLNKQVKEKQNEKKQVDFQVGLTSIKHKYEKQIQILEERQSILESQNERLKKEKKQMKDKLKDDKEKQNTMIQNKMRQKYIKDQYEQKILNLKDQFQQRLSLQERQNQKLRKEVERLRNLQKLNKKQPEIKTQKRERKKPKAKAEQNQELLSKIKIIQQQLNLLNRTIESKGKSSRSQDSQSDEEQHQSDAYYREKEIKKKTMTQKILPQSLNSSLTSQQQEQNHQFSYEKILNTKLFNNDNNNKSDLLQHSKEGLFTKKHKVLNVSDSSKGKYQFKMNKNSSDEGESLRSDSDDQNKSEGSQSENNRFNDNTEVFKSIPYKSSQMSAKRK